MAEFVVGVQVIAACVYAASGVSKLRSRTAYRSFSAGLGNTALVPPRLLRAVAAVLASGEAVIAIMVTTAIVTMTFSGSAARVLSVAALAACWVLTAGLVAGVATVVARGTIVRCACFGASSQTGPPLGAAHLLRNASLLALVTAGLLDSVLAGQPPANSITPGGWVVTAAAGAVCAAFLIRWEDVAYLVAPATVAGPTSRARVRITSPR
jgi:hypothetical protein